AAPAAPGPTPGGARTTPGTAPPPRPGSPAGVKADVDEVKGDRVDTINQGATDPNKAKPAGSGVKP
ncbi:MAG TPA: hypothetical protein VML75_27475, partial [Kofleriaceae bacterium]|nr:hypothetical protein [Kofleriaceae bacterium]